jgi:hypothetical protein
MTTLEAVQIIGKTAEIHLNGLTIEVKILDVKQSYGRTRYQVTPVAGSNEIWVESIHPVDFNQRVSR